MTKIMIGNYGWVYLQIVLDWYSKKIVGYHLSLTSRTVDWEIALNLGLNNQFPAGIKDIQNNLCLVSDNGSQPTSIRFMKTCKDLNIKQIFTSYNNPKGNADTERVIRTLKEDLIWIKEFNCFIQLEEELKTWVFNYNNIYPHSSINYKSLVEFEKEFNINYNNLLEVLPQLNFL